MVTLLALSVGALITSAAVTLVAVYLPDSGEDWAAVGEGEVAPHGVLDATSPAIAGPATPTRHASAAGSTSTGRPDPGAEAWPHPGDGVTGLPTGWKPKRVVHGSLVVKKARAVVEDVEVVGGDIEVRAPDVTVRRVRVSGGGIGNWSSNSCAGTLTIERSEILGDGETASVDGGPVIGAGSYVARHVLIDGVTEGFRVGGATDECGPAVISDSFVRIAEPVECRGDGPYPDWHGDGLQGYAGAGVTVTHTTLQMFGEAAKTPCDGTSPFFWPADSNGPARVNGLLVIGGAYYAFRIWTPGEVLGLLVASGYGGVEVGHCGLLSVWDAHYATVDLGTYTTQVGAEIACQSTG